MTTPAQPTQTQGAWTSQTVGMSWDILDRMERAVMNVRERLLRATAALNQLGVPYAVVGGNAVASWVATIDAGAVRNTRDVDLLVRRSDLGAITIALEQAGFIHDESLGADIFRDGVVSKPRKAVLLLFSGERIQSEHSLPAPEINPVDDPANFRVLALEPLLVMKLVASRYVDHAHIRDLIGVGLIDQSWLPKLPPELAPRLQLLLDTPDG